MIFDANHALSISMFDRPRLKLSGEIVYITDTSQCDKACSFIRDTEDTGEGTSQTGDCKSGFFLEAVGLDCEWPVRTTGGGQGAVALVQVTVGRGGAFKHFLFHLSALGGLPTSLKLTLPPPSPLVE